MPATGGLIPSRLRAAVAVRIGALVKVFGNPDLRLLGLCWSAWVTAMWSYAVALSVFAYLRGGPSAVAVAGLIRVIPFALLTPVGAALADHYPRHRVLAAVATLSLVVMVALTGR